MFPEGVLVDELIFEQVINRLNQLSQASEKFLGILGVRRNVSRAGELIFDTSVGEVKGSLRLEGENLVIVLETQEVSLPLVDFFGKPN